MVRKSRKSTSGRNEAQSARTPCQVYLQPAIRSVAWEPPSIGPQSRQQTLTQISFVSRAEPSDEDGLDYIEAESPRLKKKRKASAGSGSKLPEKQALQTLTQIDFVSRAKPSDDDDLDYTEEPESPRPKKRRRTSVDPGSRSKQKRAPQTLTQIDFVSRAEPSDGDDLQYRESESPRLRKRRRPHVDPGSKSKEKQAPTTRLAARNGIQRQNGSTLKVPKAMFRNAATTPRSKTFLPTKVIRGSITTPKSYSERIISSSQSPTESLTSKQSQKSVSMTPRSALVELSKNIPSFENAHFGCSQEKMASKGGPSANEDGHISRRRIQREHREKLSYSRSNNVDNMGRKPRSVVLQSHDVPYAEFSDTLHGERGTDKTGSTPLQEYEIKDSEEELDDSPVMLYTKELEPGHFTNEASSHVRVDTQLSTDMEKSNAQLLTDLERYTQDTPEKATNIRSHDRHCPPPIELHLLSRTAHKPRKDPRPSQAIVVDTTQFSQQAPQASQAALPADSPSSSLLEHLSSSPLLLRSSSSKRHSQASMHTRATTGATLLSSPAGPGRGGGSSRQANGGSRYVWDGKPLTDSQMLPDSIMNFQIPYLPPGGTQESLLEEI